MRLLDEIQSAWGWTGIKPVELIDENEFGNLIVKDVRGQYWRLCPEDCYCKIVASNHEELNRLSTNQEFLADWHMKALVDQAFDQLGLLPTGRKYYLKIPGVLGGEYGGTNLGTISLEELILASGHIAHQIENLADGTPIKLSIVE